MKINKFFNRILYDFAEIQILFQRCNFQNICKMVCNRTAKRNIISLTISVLHNIFLQKFGKRVKNKIVNFWFSNMIFQKRHKLRQKAVWKWLSVSFFDNFGCCDFIFLKNTGRILLAWNRSGYKGEQCNYNV